MTDVHKKYYWRFDILNYFINKYNYKNYLEIGVEDGDCLHAVKCENMTGVDPASKHATHKVPSNEFFKSLPPDVKYDIIFIDGLHTEDQVYDDIKNSLEHLTDTGTIVLHDCNPPSSWHQRSYEEALLTGCREWNGTVWKGFLRHRLENNNISMAVVDTDWGCGIVQKSTPKSTLSIIGPITYEGLAQNRKTWLNLITTEEFLNSY
jgi:Methyltransferase domain